MAKARTLNIIDIFKYKKDFYWDKKYFALLDQGKLVSCITFRDYYHSKTVCQIINTENSDFEFIKEFIDSYSQKNIKYFLRELDEKINLEEIKLMHDLGFKRINRNYYYEYKPDDKHYTEAAKSSINIICKEANIQDIEQILEIDKSSQQLEYRDHFHKTYKYFLHNLDDVYIFCDVNKTDTIYGFASKKAGHLDETFEFKVNQNHSNIIPNCIEAFEEVYIQFHKNQVFRFVLSENHKSILQDLEKNFSFISSSQMLITESQPKKKFGLKLPNLFPQTAATG